jgi:tetratricopeptide (TPR) repeat protein
MTILAGAIVLRVGAITIFVGAIVLPVGAIVLPVGAIASPVGAAAAPVRGLTGAAEVARVYEAIFDARFDEVRPLLEKTCPPAAPEMCRVLEAVNTWWRIQLDPKSTGRDREFQTQVEAAIAASDAWTVREPDRAEAWFVLGGAYGARVQWRVLRGERLAAARDGKRIKDALERALALDADLQDAYFGIGLYHYYADVAPAAAKLLRWLLFLPGGDRVQGLQEMLRARTSGQVLRSEADYQLHLIYLWYEKRPEQALKLLDDLRERHPRNPHFWQLIAEVQDVYLHDTHASLGSWRALLDAARARRVAEPSLAETAARLGMATELDRLGQTDAALEQLAAIVAARPAAPAGALTQAQRLQRQILTRRANTTR